MKSIRLNARDLDLGLINEEGFTMGSLNLRNEIPKEPAWNCINIDRYRLEVSLLCDLSCKYCVVHMNKISQQGKRMDLDTAQKIVSKFNEEVGEKGSLLLMGGEPLVNWDVVKYIIEENKGYTLLFTNSYKLDLDKINFLREHDTLILTSLDGYTLKHNEARFYPKVEERYKCVTQNIKNAINKGCKVGICCVAHQENVEELGEIANFFYNELNALSMSFAYPHFTIENSTTNDFSINDYTEQMYKLFDFSKENKVYIDQIGKKISAILNRERVVSACKVGISQRTFYPDGNETQCTKLDTLPNFSLDNFVNNLPFRNEKCQDCVAISLCGGGCPWDAAVYSNDIGVDKRICHYTKNIVNYIISDIEKSVQNVNSLDEAVDIIKSRYLPLTKPSYFAKRD